MLCGVQEAVILVLTRGQQTALDRYSGEMGVLYQFSHLEGAGCVGIYVFMASNRRKKGDQRKWKWF